MAALPCPSLDVGTTSHQEGTGAFVRAVARPGPHESASTSATPTRRICSRPGQRASRERASWPCPRCVPARCVRPWPPHGPGCSRPDRETARTASEDHHADLALRTAPLVHHRSARGRCPTARRPTSSIRRPAYDDALRPGPPPPRPPRALQRRYVRRRSLAPSMSISPGDTEHRKRPAPPGPCGWTPAPRLSELVRAETPQVGLRTGAKGALRFDDRCDAC